MGHPFKHFLTITYHRHLVFCNCVKAGIPWQGLIHDLSKFSPTEFIPGSKFYSGTKSPTEDEREVYGYSAAWIHHKGRNKHHFEYWTDYNNVTHIMGPVKMPVKYVIEMFCDRIAASKVYSGKNYTNDKPLQYFLRGRSRRAIEQETSILIENLLKMLAEKGEKETFSFIKHQLLHKEGK